jgi:hypothetical protein
LDAIKKNDKKKVQVIANKLLRRINQWKQSKFFNSTFSGEKNASYFEICLALHIGTGERSSRLFSTKCEIR